MSLISVSRCSPARSISASCSPGCAGFSFCSMRVSPRMPCSGVRISWLMVARNWLFTLLWRCARSSAWARSSAMRSVVKRSISSSRMRDSPRCASMITSARKVSVPSPTKSPKRDAPSIWSIATGKSIESRKAAQALKLDCSTKAPTAATPTNAASSRATRYTLPCGASQMATRPQVKPSRISVTRNQRRHRPSLRKEVRKKRWHNSMRVAETAQRMANQPQTRPLST